jgi:hypothetical protein
MRVDFWQLCSCMMYDDYVATGLIRPIWEEQP